jgi:hypothetical protein
MKRKKGVKRVNPERKKRLFAAHYGNDAYVEALHKEGCQVSGCAPTSGSRAKIECAHHPTKATTGTWRDITPLCAYHHRVQHDIGVVSFEAFYGIDLKATNAAMVLQHGHLVTDPDGLTKFVEDATDWEYVDLEDC